LEQLDDLVRERSQLVSRAERLVDADDISPRIVKEAAGLERWAEVQPSLFEDTLDQELAKYDKFRHDIEEGSVRQAELLDNVKGSLLSAGVHFRPRSNHYSCLDPDGFIHFISEGRSLSKGPRTRVAVTRPILS
jgi:late p6Gag/p9Gag-like protein